jgi:hypothetical protein
LWGDFEFRGNDGTGNREIAKPYPQPKPKPATIATTATKLPVTESLVRPRFRNRNTAQFVPLSAETQS